LVQLEAREPIGTSEKLIHAESYQKTW
jgi:hypothetical protein